MFKAKLRVIEVSPTGTRATTGFVCTRDGTSGVATVDLPIYPPSLDGERFAATRKRLGLSLRDAADRLGLRPTQVSGLEFGRVTLDDWQAAFKRLQEDR